jgi:hypothetical protein
MRARDVRTLVSRDADRSSLVVVSCRGGWLVATIHILAWHAIFPFSYPEWSFWMCWEITRGTFDFLGTRRACHKYVLTWFDAHDLYMLQTLITNFVYYDEITFHDGLPRRVNTVLC